MTQLYNSRIIRKPLLFTKYFLKILMLITDTNINMFKKRHVNTTKNYSFKNK